MLVENKKRKKVEKIVLKMNRVERKYVVTLGVSFKPDVNSRRDVSSIDTIRELVEAGTKIQAYCSEGMREVSWRLEEYENSTTYCTEKYSTVNEIKVVVLMTKWYQFREMNLEKLRERTRDNHYFDLRNVQVKDIKTRELFKYYLVGWE